MQLPWHAWRRRKRKATFEGNPFISKKTLGRFLGQLASGVFNGEISEGEARACEKVIVDFFKLLTVKDFTFELNDAIEPEDARERLPYAT